MTRFLSFVYGGFQDPIVYGDVWVLSIPGFFWTKVHTSEIGRTRHACVLAGRRQMISIGGLAGSADLNLSQWSADGPDPFT